METFIVDSFTDQAFRGNPAGVCLPDNEIGDDLMLSIAQELNFSETAFIRQADGQNAYTIRYFSPVMEIPLCGHATLAAAKVLFTKTHMTEIRFHTIEGLELLIKNSDGKIVMEFPVYELEPSEVSEATLQALGLESAKYAAYNHETKILLLEISSTEILGNLKPDFQALLRTQDTINGILVTAISQTDGYDFHSRYFWPWSGTNEDPVTGGTHTFLAKYWGEKLNKTKMKSFQASARTGAMEVELTDNNKLLIKSEAVIILEGSLTL